ncbi:hypothetical protein [Bacteroides fragilis]|jgi:hypothetical protein|uniref:hypothetical protein n=1 Tax=Bacteroides fragilis TaxID=817 RepID=UPI00101D504C|nr:hypothetical protein [Bacteroides fragilis]MBA5650839.1 hypothetical protein [Bacteroides fragilis]MCE9401880.1 hypothetical protein [Bacteroides fragilis]MCZ2501374.1 hypothetical protein [Bacteroides fragilis]
MEDIKKISIVCSTGAETYQIGEIRNGKVISKIERFPGYEDMTGAVFSGNFLVKDKVGNRIAEISDNAPYVIEFA